MKYPNIDIKKISTKGYGVFALDDIEEDTMICEYIGNIMTEEEISKHNLTKKDGKERDDIFSLFKNKNGKALQIIPLTHCNIARFLNCSMGNEKPNV